MNHSRETQMVTVAKHTFIFYFNVNVHRLVYTVAAPADLSNCTANIIAATMINSYNMIVLTGPVQAFVCIDKIYISFAYLFVKGSRLTLPSTEP